MRLNEGFVCSMTTLRFPLRVQAACQETALPQGVLLQSRRPLNCRNQEESAGLFSQERERNLPRGSAELQARARIRVCSRRWHAACEASVVRPHDSGILSKTSRDEEESKMMRKMLKLVSVALLALVVMAGMFAPATTLSAGEEADLDKMISSAKTAADHEAIAAEYERRATAAKEKSAEHVEMGETYKKQGGALIEKHHIDTHCDALANLYKKIAKEFEILAKDHKAMAKEAK
jgi:hypothetical protein